MGNFAREVGAIFLRPSADGDDVVPRLPQIFLHGVGRMVGKVDACFCHDLHGMGIYGFGGRRACRANLQPRVGRLQEAVCHLAAATVAGT